MSLSNMTAEMLATLAGAGILAASANMNIMATGGYFTSHAALVASLTLGVFAGSRVIGSGAGKLGLVIVAALVAGEMFNFAATSERVVVERETGAAPLRALKVKRDAAIQRLHDLETGMVSTSRLTLAKQAKAAADKAVDAEARDGGCKRICQMKQAEAAKAQAEVVAASAEAERLHQTDIQSAQAEVKANPLPPSSTPLADRLGWAPWVLDLIMAGLLSIGANGLAGTLIAYGAHSVGAKTALTAANDADQTDFSASDFDAAKLRSMVSGDIPGKPTPPNKPRKRGRKADQNVIDFTQKFREKTGRTPSGSELRKQFPALPVSTAYDYAARAKMAV